MGGAAGPDSWPRTDHCGFVSLSIQAGGLFLAPCSEYLLPGGNGAAPVLRGELVGGAGGSRLDRCITLPSEAHCC